MEVLLAHYAVYRPVVVPAPKGDDAVALWDLVRSMQRFPHVYELRHPKTIDDLLHVGEQFGTVLSTRTCVRSSTSSPRPSKLHNRASPRVTRGAGRVAELRRGCGLRW